MIFGSALSGINAASTALKVTGNNVANADTTGFKSSRADFGDVYAVAYNGISSEQPGQGVRLEDINQNFSQGTINNTGGNLDLAISGNGFFALDNQGARVYSRAGSFHVDRNGNVVNTKNQGLLVFGAVGKSGKTFNTANPQPLNVNTSEGAPKATSQLKAIANLNAQSSALGSGTVAPGDPTTYTFSTAGTVYDSLGASHTSTLYFRKVKQDAATGHTVWDVAQYVDGKQLTPKGQTAGTPAQIEFDSSGQLVSPSSGAISYKSQQLSNGAADLNLSLDMSGTTQYGDSSSVSSLSQDGYTTGQLHGINIGTDGVVSASYTNGQSKALGKVALANFADPNGLQQLGDTSWGQTYESGDAQLGTPGSGGFGQIQSGGLEASNVDLPQQLVNLITEQRDYQANARVISTANNITQTIINMR